MPTCLEDEFSEPIPFLKWLGTAFAVLTLLHAWTTTVHNRHLKDSFLLPKIYFISQNAALAIMSIFACTISATSDSYVETASTRRTRKTFTWLWVILALMSRIISVGMFSRYLWSLRLPRRAWGSEIDDTLRLVRGEGKKHALFLVIAEATVGVLGALLGSLQYIAPKRISYHKVIFSFLASFVFVDMALFSILGLVALDIRGRDQKSDYINAMNSRVIVTGCSSFIVQCTVLIVVIKLWSSGYSFGFLLTNEKDTCDPVNFLNEIIIPFFTLSFLLINMAVSKINFRDVCYDHASNFRRCANFAEQLGDAWQNLSFNGCAFDDISLNVHSSFSTDPVLTTKYQVSANAWSALDVSLNTGDPGAMIIPMEFISIEPNPVASGGFGQVHLGTFAGKRVAVKKIYSQMLDGSLEELRHEIRILSNLQGFPHIVLLHGVSLLEYFQETILLIVLEYCPLPLTAFLSDSSPENAMALSPTLFIAVAKQLANALHVLHFKGYVHLDIKPENILFANPGDLSSSLRIVDLGTTCMVDSKGSCSLKSNLEKMSPFYAPPEAISTIGMLNAVTMSRTSEQMPQEEYDGRCFDIYSLSITLWAVWHQQATPDLSHQVQYTETQNWSIVYADVADSPVLLALYLTKLGWRPDVMRSGGQLGRIPEPLASLVTKSWSHKPHDRPRASDLVRELSAPAIGTSIQEAQEAFDRDIFGHQGKARQAVLALDTIDDIKISLLASAAQAEE